MDKPFSGKIAIVTGGTRGIGRAIVERLLAEGAAVATCGASPANVDKAIRELSSGGRFFAQAADVSKLDNVLRFFEAVDQGLGTVDFLINNAGVGIYKPVIDLNPEEWHRMID